MTVTPPKAPIHSATEQPASSTGEQPLAARLVSLVGSPEAYPLPCLDPVPVADRALTPDVLALWFLHKRETRANGSDPILLADGRWLPRETAYQRKSLAAFTATEAFASLSTTRSDSLRQVLSALEPVPGDYFRVETHTRMLSSPAPKVVDGYLRWWSRNVATALYWTGTLPQATADSVVSRFPELSNWRRAEGTGKWLDSYTVCRDVYAAVGGTVSAKAELVDEYVSREDVDPQFIRRRLSTAYRLSSTASARGSKSNPAAAEESSLRSWLSRATPWLVSGAPHLSASWRSRLLEHLDGDTDKRWVDYQLRSQLRSRLSGAQHRVLDAVDGWQWLPDPYPGFRRLSPAYPGD